MATQIRSIMLGPSASQETHEAVQRVLSEAGMTAAASPLEDKGLPDIPLDPETWDHVINIVLEQVKGLYEDTRSFLAGLVIENFRQGRARRRQERLAELGAAEATVSPADLAAAARQFRQLVQGLQELQASQATGPVRVRLVIGDLWVSCPQASTSSDVPFLALLDPQFDGEAAGGFFGATRWDGAAQRWVPEPDEQG